MKNINEIHLEDIISDLKTAHVKLDLKFLKILIQNAAGCERPWRNIEFSEKIGCNINTKIQSATGINGWINGHTTVPVSKLIKIVELSKYNWTDVEKNLTYIKAGQKRGEVRPKFPIKLDHKIGAIIGHILGDGSINKRGESIFFCNSNPELLKEFMYFMKEIFDVEPRIWVQKPKIFEEKTEWLKRINCIEEIPPNHVVSLFYPKICVRIIKTLFGNFADGRSKKITTEIKYSPFELKRGLIRAFFDDEGTVYTQRIALRVFQDNKEILENIRIMLKEFDINSDKISSYTKRDKERYYFTISNYRDCFSYYIKIGFTSSAKSAMLASLIYRLRNGKKWQYIRRLELSV